MPDRPLFQYLGDWWQLCHRNTLPDDHDREWPGLMAVEENLSSILPKVN